MQDVCVLSFGVGSCCCAPGLHPRPSNFRCGLECGGILFFPFAGNGAGQLHKHVEIYSAHPVELGWTCFKEA